MPLGMLNGLRTHNLFLYRSNKTFRYAPGIDAMPEGIDFERVRSAEVMESGSSLIVFLFLARKSAVGKGDMRGRGLTCVAISRRMGGRLIFIYTPVFSISWFS